MVIGRLRRDPARTTQRVRTLLTLTALSAWALVLGIRLVQLQVYEHDRLAERARVNRTKTIKLQGLRGDIFARGGEKLATSVQRRSIYAQRDDVIDPDLTARLLAPALGTTEAALRKRLEGSRFVYLYRKAPDAVVENVRELVRAHDLVGINDHEEYKRYYPHRTLAAQTIGAVNMDNEGQFGVERQYDAWIAGEEGTHYAARDATNTVIGSHGTIMDNPTRGDDLYLTLDWALQHAAEEALREGVINAEAKGGVVVVMDVRTGEVRAMANYPTFDLNDNNSREYRENQPNRAVAHAIEPGSVLKVFTVAAAMQEELTFEDDVIDCQGGLLVVPGGFIRDWKPGFGELTVRQVLMQSSNVGTAKVALRMEPGQHHQWLLDFGFASRTQVGLPGEQAGYLASPTSRSWSGRTQQTIAFGQEISSTPLQVATALAAIANGGVLMRPRIVGAVHDRAGELRTDRLLRDGTPVGSALVRHRVLNEDIARRVALMMESVVAGGTGSTAQIEGYRIGGKTSTAQKFDNDLGAYGGFVAGFGGFFPVSDPELAMFVAIDEPRRGSAAGHGGSSAAGPVFRQVAQAAIRILRIAPDADKLPAPSVVADAIAAATQRVSPLP